MRNKNNKHLGIEIDPELHYKVRYITEYYVRSINGLVIYLLREFVKDFENKYGKIEVKHEEKD